MVKRYKTNIIKLLKDNGSYNDGLGVVINSLSDTLQTLDLCRKEISTLEKTTVYEVTRYGKKLAPHPVFKIQRDAQDTLIKCCKSLGMTYKELSEVVESSPLVNLIDSMRDENTVDD